VVEVTTEVVPAASVVAVASVVTAVVSVEVGVVAASVVAGASTFSAVEQASSADSTNVNILTPILSFKSLQR
jgi:hypothetical protein